MNVTIPHKHAALALADRASDAALAIGAANTLTFEDGAIVADNTDAPGAAGGAARAARRPDRARARRRRRGPRRGVGAGPRRGRRDDLEPHRPSARARSPRRSAREPSEAPAPRRSSSTARRSASHDPEATFKALPIEADELGAGSLVVDMVYRAGGTRLLEAARTRGARVVDGLEILVAQGAASFERWTGLEAPREAMRAAATTIAET